MAARCDDRDRILGPAAAGGYVDFAKNRPFFATPPGPGRRAAHGPAANAQRYLAPRRMIRPSASAGLA